VVKQGGDSAQRMASPAHVAMHYEKIDINRLKACPRELIR
jgi:hypothetical protein